MKISRKDVEHVARLARLKLTEEEKEKYTGQLEAIFGYIDKLSALDTNNVKPTSHIMGLKNVWREDELKPCSDAVREALLANAPDREDDYFKVKKVIE
jgi:aspartyl-tRNA(Asn)/glutamyl-tRNA(Gln) amidotransferase subunit C